MAIPPQQSYKYPPTTVKLKNSKGIYPCIRLYILFIQPAEGRKATNGFLNSNEFALCLKEAFLWLCV